MPLHQREGWTQEGAPKAFVDLHSHSSSSFDSLSDPIALTRAAAERGITHLAITDHDRVDGAQRARDAQIPGITVIVGSEVRTRDGDMIAGLPREVIITSTEITEAMEVPLRNLTDAIRGVLEQTPPELSADIIDKGIVLSGGGALLRNIDRLITNVTGVATHVAPDPLSCVAKGTGIALEHFDVFAKSLTSQA